ncbi:MAG: UDP-N-acetylmuramoyl-L-alanyl-D-glutamate--2,6-diaminopimelate ligase [Clostridia bacterium 41_269]|nr:MAG: UDP-N-acetylmuramoyl-L-alanyl-D-glutamate--2,6-diaminopimelate ligase [Clostridia bacterium 41_269]
MVDLKSIKEIIGAVEWQGNLNTVFKEVKYDSRKVKEGDLFVAIKGYKNDGHDYIKEAVSNGAAALVIERTPSLGVGVPWLRVRDSRFALSLISAHINGYPSQKLRIIGVTGTNGKTTTTNLIETVLLHAGKKASLMGTVENRILGKPIEAKLTTPDSPELQALLAEMAAAGSEYAVMEVSSHALKLKRVAHCEFDVAVFTNITQDHLDFHPTFEDYFNTKAELFYKLHQGVKQGKKYGVVNLDDPHGKIIAEKARVPIITYGFSENAHAVAKDVNIGPKGTNFKISYEGMELELSIKLIGRFNVYNVLAAFCVAVNEGIDVELIKEALEKAKGVPGRFEAVDEGQDFSVIVDYAHTPDGLKNILETAREITQGRVITVFGCGGDRDRTKRPLMGKAAALYSDYCIITSDNPRSESPQAIIEDILPGVKKITSGYKVIENRSEAINEAVRMAQKGDLVIIAGKGHETYQIIGSKVYHFDDREEARKALRRMKK